MTPESAQKRAEELAEELGYTKMNYNDLAKSESELGAFKQGYLAAYHDLAPKIEKLVEALEWYAETSKWQDHDLKGRYYRKGEGVFYIERGTDFGICEAGEKAREALKQWKEGG